MKRLLCAALCALSVSAFAAYPEKPVRLVLPYSPGGGADVTGRPLAHYLGERMGQQFVVENMGGAGGNIAMQTVAHAAPDGYTLVLCLTPQLSVNQSLYKNLPYDPVKDFAPISLIGSAPYFLGVNPNVPAKTFGEFIALARAKPGELSYASTGNGSGLHLAMELVKSMAKIELVHVPYKGGGAALTDVLAGNVPAMFMSYGAGSAYIKSGRVRILAVTSAQRSPLMPDVPPVADTLPGYEAGAWYAVLAPRGTPPAIVKRLHDEIVELLKANGDLRERFAGDGVRPIGSTPEELAAYAKAETVKWAAVVKRAGVKVE